MKAIAQQAVIEIAADHSFGAHNRVIAFRARGAARVKVNGNGTRSSMISYNVNFS